MPTSYSYAALPSGRWVRLLQIVPDESSEHGFFLQLRDYRLDDAPPFYALSYTWSCPDFPEDEDQEDATTFYQLYHVDCDGMDMQVGENLLDFLRQMKKDMLATAEALEVKPDAAPANSLHHKVVVKRHAHFWIDAVCINQEDHEERSLQVQLMGDIYESATNVIVWLGQTEPNENVHWVLDVFAPIILHHSKKRVLQLLQNGGPELQHPDFVKMAGEDFCKRWRESYTDFFAFFSKKKWLTRGWVVQEVSIPVPDTVVVLCGTSQFSWSIINRLSSLMLIVSWEDPLYELLSRRLPSWRRRPGTLNRLWNPMSITVPDFRSERLSPSVIDWKHRRWGAVTDEEVRHAEVMHIFHRLRFNEFQNPLDHIYGALGLIDRVLGPNHKLGIVPSYEIPVEQLLVDVTTWLLQHLPNLDILGMAGLRKGKREALPSWVTDFTYYNPSPIQYTPLQRLRQQSKYSRWRRPLDATHTARGVPKPVARISGPELVLDGVRFETVEKLEYLRHDEQRVLNDISWILDVCERGGNYASTNETPTEAIVKTLTADLKPRAVAETEYAARCERWVRDCVTYNWLMYRGQSALDISCRLDDGYGEKRRPLINLYDALEAALQEDFGPNFVNDPITKIVHFISFEKKVLMTYGGYLGLGPSEAEPGDEIWLANGGRMPLLLRKKEASSADDGSPAKASRDTYILVGEVYLHGNMYGEMMTNEQKEKFQEVVIV